jgi:hypothetical protein
VLGVSTVSDLQGMSKMPAAPGAGSRSGRGRSGSASATGNGTRNGSRGRRDDRSASISGRAGPSFLSNDVSLLSPSHCLSHNQYIYGNRSQRPVQNSKHRSTTRRRSSVRRKR